MLQFPPIKISYDAQTFIVITKHASKEMKNAIKFSMKAEAGNEKFIVVYACVGNGGCRLRLKNYFRKQRGGKSM